MSDVIAIIPARGGSRGVPRKNIKPLAGKPLIVYSIEQALAAPSIDRCIVSTDDEEIAQIAREAGAEAPFLRPVELAQDATPDLPVFDHALRYLKEHEGFNPEIVVHIRPTSPLRTVEDVERAISLIKAHPEADSVRSVVPSPITPYKMWRIIDGWMTPLLEVPGNPEPYNAARQLLPIVYWHVGCVDVIHGRTILEKKSMAGKKILPLILSDSRIVDIDSEFDFTVAELLLSQKKSASL